MNALILMIPATLLLAFGFTLAFIYMAKRGQFDDLETPAFRPLTEGDPLNDIDSIEKRAPEIGTSSRST